MSILVESVTLERIRTPVQLAQAQGQLQFTCLSVSETYVAVGSTSGCFYLFDKTSLDHLQIVPPREASPSVFVRISPDQKYAAHCLLSGNLEVLELSPLQSHQQSRKVLSGGDSAGDIVIRDVCWHPESYKVYTGDSKGEVKEYDFRFILRVTKSPILDSPIVQIDSHRSSVLVSTRSKSYLFKQGLSGSYQQIGSNIRNGSYGSVFLHPPQSSSNSPIYCARPGLRLWEVDSDGGILNTQKYKELLNKPPTHTVSFRNPTLPESPTSNAVGSHRLFGYLVQFRKQWLLTWDKHCLYILDPTGEPARVVLWTDEYKDMQSVGCHGDSVYLLCPSSRLYCLSVPYSFSHALSSLSVLSNCLPGVLLSLQSQDSLLVECETGKLSSHVPVNRSSLSVADGAAGLRRRTTTALNTLKEQLTKHCDNELLLTKRPGRLTEDSTKRQSTSDHNITTLVDDSKMADTLRTGEDRFDVGHIKPETDQMKTTSVHLPEKKESGVERDQRRELCETGKAQLLFELEELIGKVLEIERRVTHRDVTAPVSVAQRRSDSQHVTSGSTSDVNNRICGKDPVAENVCSSSSVTLDSVDRGHFSTAETASLGGDIEGADDGSPDSRTSFGSTGRLKNLTTKVSSKLTSLYTKTASTVQQVSSSEPISFLRHSLSGSDFRTLGTSAATSPGMISLESSGSHSCSIPSKDLSQQSNLSRGVSLTPPDPSFFEDSLQLAEKSGGTDVVTHSSNGSVFSRSTVVGSMQSRISAVFPSLSSLSRNGSQSEMGEKIEDSRARSPEKVALIGEMTIVESFPGEIYPGEQDEGQLPSSAEWTNNQGIIYQSVGPVVSKPAYSEKMTSLLKNLVEESLAFQRDLDGMLLFNTSDVTARLETWVEALHGAMLCYRKEMDDKLQNTDTLYQSGACQPGAYQSGAYQSGACQPGPCLSSVDRLADTPNINLSLPHTHKEGLASPSIPVSAVEKSTILEDGVIPHTTAATADDHILNLSSSPHSESMDPSGDDLTESLLSCLPPQAKSLLTIQNPWGREVASACSTIATLCLSAGVYGSIGPLVGAVTPAGCVAEEKQTSDTDVAEEKQTSDTDVAEEKQTSDTDVAEDLLSCANPVESVKSTVGDQDRCAALWFSAMYYFLVEKDVLLKMSQEADSKEMTAICLLAASRDDSELYRYPGGVNSHLSDVPCLAQIYRNILKSSNAVAVEPSTDFVEPISLYHLAELSGGDKSNIFLSYMESFIEVSSRKQRMLLHKCMSSNKKLLKWWIGEIWNHKPNQTLCCPCGAPWPGSYCISWEFERSLAFIATVLPAEEWNSFLFHGYWKGWATRSLSTVTMPTRIAFALQCVTERGFPDLTLSRGCNLTEEGVVTMLLLRHRQTAAEWSIPDHMCPDPLNSSLPTGDHTTKHRQTKFRTRNDKNNSYTNEEQSALGQLQANSKPTKWRGNSHPCADEKLSGFKGAGEFTTGKGSEEIHRCLWCDNQLLPSHATASAPRIGPLPWQFVCEYVMSHASPLVLESLSFRLPSLGVPLEDITPLLRSISHMSQKRFLIRGMLSKVGKVCDKRSDLTLLKRASLLPSSRSLAEEDLKRMPVVAKAAEIPVKVRHTSSMTEEIRKYLGLDSLTVMSSCSACGLPLKDTSSPTHTNGGSLLFACGHGYHWNCLPLSYCFLCSSGGTEQLCTISTSLQPRH